jgi:hypothetical protein
VLRWCFLPVVSFVPGFWVGGSRPCVGSAPFSPSVVWRPVPSAVGLPVSVPGSVASAASLAGASFFGVRPSSRSFSGWVGVCWFSSRRGASAFAASFVASGEFVVLVRRCGPWWVVSVPVSVRSFSFVVGSSVPFSVWPL